MGKELGRICILMRVLVEEFASETVIVLCVLGASEACIEKMVKFAPKARTANSLSGPLFGRHQCWQSLMRFRTALHALSDKELAFSLFFVSPDSCRSLCSSRVRHSRKLIAVQDRITVWETTYGLFFYWDNHKWDM